jgi:hypothetical protein
MSKISIFGGLLLAIHFGTCAFGQAPGSTSSEHVFVGILDDNRHEVANWEPGPARRRMVRIAFEKTAKGWETVPSDSTSIPQTVRWTVVFDGRSLGRIQTEDSKLPSGEIDRESDYNARIQEIVTDAEKVPVVGKPASKFAPLGEADGPSRARRPLVVVSKPNFTDPDGWKRIASPPGEVSILLRDSFRRDFSQVVRCKDEKIVKRNWRFPDSALSFPVAYASGNGTFLVETDLDAGNCGYIDDPNDPLSDPWFFVDADGKVKRIGSFLYLLDAGDYDNDGRSELIFGLNQPEDTDGFVLYDADLNKRAELTWAYH